MALLKRSGLRFERDIIFLGTGDEEVGGRKGAGWFVDKHFDAIADAEFLLTEGGGIRQREGKRSYRVSVAEKAPCWIELKATGPAGHGSSPVPETAVTRLVRALEKIRRYETPFKVVPAVQAYFNALAQHQDEETAQRYRALEQALKDEAFRKKFTATPSHNALVRNTISLTVLNGSPKTNVVPASASAQLDCRLLPGEDPQTFLAHLKQLVDDPHIEFSTLLNFPAVASDPDTPPLRRDSFRCRTPRPTRASHTQRPGWLHRHPLFQGKRYYQLWLFRLSAHRGGRPRRARSERAHPPCCVTRGRASTV